MVKRANYKTTRKNVREIINDTITDGVIDFRSKRQKGEIEEEIVEEIVSAFQWNGEEDGTTIPVTVNGDNKARWYGDPTDGGGVIEPGDWIVEDSEGKHSIVKPGAFSKDFTLV